MSATSDLNAENVLYNPQCEVRGVLMVPTAGRQGRSVGPEGRQGDAENAERGYFTGQWTLRRY